MCIEEYLKEKLKFDGYDGICNREIDCGCGFNNFITCDGIDMDNCKPAYEHECVTCPEKETCVYRIATEADGCYGTKKPDKSIALPIKSKK